MWKNGGSDMVMKNWTNSHLKFWLQVHESWQMSISQRSGMPGTSRPCARAKSPFKGGRKDFNEGIELNVVYRERKHELEGTLKKGKQLKGENHKDGKHQCLLSFLRVGANHDHLFILRIYLSVWCILDSEQMFVIIK